MKTITLNISENTQNLLEEYVHAGIFKSEEDVLVTALAEFLRRNRVELIEKFALEDIEWAFRKGRS